MDAKREKTISKFISLVLRHEPEAAGLSLDASGWMNFDALCSALEAKFSVTPADVRGIVARDPKGRYVLEGSRIRAAQGHSLDVDLDLEATQPPAQLFHGTTGLAWERIRSEGLDRQQRRHVHLSPDVETARIVGVRRPGGLVILGIASGAMAQAGFQFYRADNGVWLTGHVPANFLNVVETG